MATVYVDISTDVDIDEIDFMEECTERERQIIIKWLIENKYISRKNTHIENSNEIIWNNAVSKFIDNKHLLTQEEETIILNIASKL
jgi:hypothetical protein